MHTFGRQPDSTNPPGQLPAFLPRGAGPPQELSNLRWTNKRLGEKAGSALGLSLGSAATQTLLWPEWGAAGWGGQCSGRCCARSLEDRLPQCWVMLRIQEKKP